MDDRREREKEREKRRPKQVEQEKLEKYERKGTEQVYSEKKIGSTKY